MRFSELPRFIEQIPDRVLLNYLTAAPDENMRLVHTELERRGWFPVTYRYHDENPDRGGRVEGYGAILVDEMTQSVVSERRARVSEGGIVEALARAILFADMKPLKTDEV